MNRKSCKKTDNINTVLNGSSAKTGAATVYSSSPLTSSAGDPLGGLDNFGASNSFTRDDKTVLDEE